MGVGIGNCIIVLFFSIQFMLIGHWMLTKLGIAIDNICLRLSGGFFTGAAIYLALLRTTTLVFRSFRISFWITFFLCVFFNVAERQTIRKAVGNLHCRLIGVGALVWILNILHQALIWMLDVEEGVHLASDFGSYNTMRYTNLVWYFMSTDSVPIINQSYGQSLLASICCMFGLDYSVFSMSLWLSMSKAMMLFFLYGIMRKFFSHGLSMALTALVFIGNVSLSPYPVMNVDTGSPFAYSGYTDSVIGVCVFVIYLLYLYHVLEDSCRLDGWHLFFSVCIMAYCCMSAPQNIILTVGCGFVLLVCLLWKKEFKLVKRSLAVFVMMMAGLALGVSEGGMLTPSQIIQDIDLAGTMTVIKEGEKGASFTLVPMMTYHIGLNSTVLRGWSHGISYMSDMLQYAVKGWQSGDYGIFLYHLSLLLWDGVRVIFWAMLGMLGVCIRAYLKKDGRIGFFAASGTATLLFGFIITFFFSYSGRKMELVRFMLPGYFLGMIFMAVILGKLWRKQKILRYLSALSMFAILVGQVPYRLVDIARTIQEYDVVRCFCRMVVFENQYIR